MLGLTTLGFIHTLIGLVAVAVGFYILARTHEIGWRDALGKTYVVTTFLTAATGLGIYQHGGFGAPHVLSILTLIALVVGTVAATTRFYGRASRYVQAVAYSTTILFHLIPAFTETLTRVPREAPIASSPQAPIMQVIAAVLLVLYAIGLTLQIRWMRASRPVMDTDDEDIVTP
jgi:uncharacterized membrane protein